MTMALADPLLAIQTCGKTTILQDTRIRSETHSPALLHHPLLLIHQSDNRMRGVWVNLTGIGPSQTTGMTAELDNRHLHTETYAEEGYSFFPGITDRGNFAFGSPLTKAHRHKQPI